jgi:pimeloyl-ACP methyl ester carboxylesterase
VTEAALTNGVFPDGIPYLRFGTGSKTMLFLAGGPGNIVPTGFGASGFVRGMRPFADEYTIYLVTRKSGLPRGYTTKDMSDDYAELIRAEFGGHVDMVVGVSYGGLIAQYLAADHPDLFGHIVIAMSAHRVSDAARRIDNRYAELIHEGRDRDAMAQRAEPVFRKGPLRALLGGVLWLVGKPLLGKLDDTFRDDVIIEADAESNHDATEALKRIRVHVLIVGGKDDFAFPVSYMEEMAELIPDATLKIYEGGHMTAFTDDRFAPDVREFTASHSEEGGKGDSQKLIDAN